MARLDTICSMNMGQSPESSSYNDKGDGLPFFQGNADFGTVHPKVRVWCNTPTKIAHAGDILISVRAPIGALNIADQECCIGRGLAALTVDEERFSKRYIWHALTSKVGELNAKGTGSTFKAIGKGALAETEIATPSFSEQEKIADKLDVVTSIIAHRKQQLAELDNLVKARFVEMFGDPVSNAMAWQMGPLKETCTLMTGNTPSRTIKEYYGSYIEWIKSDNITNSSLYLTTAAESLSEKGAEVGRVVHPGAILMTCIAGSLNTIGNVAIVDRDVAFNQQINAIIPHQYDTLFLCYLLKLLKPKLHEAASSALKCILNKGNLETFTAIVPEMALQKEFSSFVAQSDKSKVAVQKALDEAQTLFDSLMQQYFG